MECQSKIKSFIVSFIPIPFIIIFIFLISQGEEYDYKFWKNLSEILIVVVIFTISSLWAVRASAYYSFRQGRSDFYQYMSDRERNEQYTGTEDIIKDPASQYLGSARSFRRHATIYNMTIFYLLLCFFILFIQFLFNLKEGNIAIWFWALFLIILVYLLFKIKSITKVKKIWLLVALWIVLPVLSILFLWKGVCPQHILKICCYELTTVLSLINILLFSLASYTIYLGCIVFIKTYLGPDPFNNLVIWTHDNMNKIFPFLEKKKEAQMNPDVIKENKMVNLWKWSLILNLKEIFDHMNHNGSIDKNHRKNEENIGNLIDAINSSEWEDPAIIYLYAIVRRLFSFLRIDNYPITPQKDQSKNKKRYQNAEEAAEKRYSSSLEIRIEELNKIKNYRNKKQIEKEIKFLGELLKKLKKNMKEDLYNEIKQEINKLNRELSSEGAMIYKETIKREIEYLEKLREYEILKKLLNAIMDKKEIEKICEKLIDVYKDRIEN